MKTKNQIRIIKPIFYFKKSTEEKQNNKKKKKNGENTEKSRKNPRILF